MAFDLPALPSTGDVADIANWAEPVRNSLQYMKGQAGTVTFESAVILSSGNLTVNSGTTVCVRTKELYIPVNEGYTDGTPGAALGGYATVGLADGAEKYVVVNWLVEDDFISLTSIKLIWNTAAASGNMYWKFTASYAASAQAEGTHTDSPAYGVTAAGAGGLILNVQEPANPLTLASLAVGDYVSIRATRDGSDGSDTLNDVAYVVGFLITYVSNR